VLIATSTMENVGESIFALHMCIDVYYILLRNLNGFENHKANHNLITILE